MMIRDVYISSELKEMKHKYVVPQVSVLRAEFSNENFLN